MRATLLFLRLRLPLLTTGFLLVPMGAAIAQPPPAAQEKPLPSVAQPAAPVPRVLPGEWELKPVVRIGDPAPETGGRFEEFGERFWLDSGVLIFWGRFGPKEWALYSWKDGRLQLVVPEGNDVQCTHAEGVTEKLEIHHGTGWRERTHLQEGRGILYMSMHFGGLGKTASIYAWDGEVLRKVLARGDTISMAGVSHKVRYARILDMAPDGTAVIFIETEEKRSGLVLHDGTRLTPLLLEQAELPGMPEVTLKSHWIRGIAAAHAVVPGMAFVEAEVTGAPYKVALLRLTPGKVESVLGLREPYSSAYLRWSVGVGFEDPYASAYLRSSGAGGSDLLLFLTAPGEKSESALVLYQAGQLKPVAARSSLYRFLPRLDEISIRGTKLLQNDPPRFVFLATASETQRWKDWQYLHIATFFSTALLLFDGDRLRPLNDKLPLGLASYLHRLSGDFPGVVLEATPVSEDPVRVTTGAGRIIPSPGTTWWFLDAGSDDIRLEPAPEFKTSDGRRVHLGNVLGWSKPGRAVVQLSGDFYLLTKR